MDTKRREHIASILRLSKEHKIMKYVDLLDDLYMEEEELLRRIVAIRSKIELLEMGIMYKYNEGQI